MVDLGYLIGNIWDCKYAIYFLQIGLKTKKIDKQHNFLTFYQNYRILLCFSYNKRY